MKNFYYNIIETKTSKNSCGRKQTTNIYLKNKFVTAKQNNDPKGLNDYY